jgi:MFS family permease
MAPSALSILTSTFVDPKERGRAFGVFGAISGVGGAVGLLLGGALTEYLSWRWALYVNLLFAAVALAGAAVLLGHQRPRGGQRLDAPGALLIGGALLNTIVVSQQSQMHGGAVGCTRCLPGLKPRKDAGRTRTVMVPFHK